MKGISLALRSRIFFLTAAIWVWGYGPNVVNAADSVPKDVGHRIEKAVDAAASESMEKLHIPGAAVIVTKGSRVVLSKGYGWADMERQVKMDPERSIVRLGSLAKPLTAAAAMQLVEKGKLSLSADINRYLAHPGMPNYKNRPITLKHLLTHTAGLDQLLYQTAARSRDSTVAAEQLLYEYFGNQPPVRLPGEQMDYNNAGYGMIGLLVERAGRQPFETYMSEHIFEPLDMPTASLDSSAAPPAQLAQSYTYSQGQGYTRI
ncbi:serine hydrolase domain-containing protein [Paenibacillus sp. JX-17]|uniref:Serine hydrolase domain-containing protein n=1 Tax=Paenibacillus lacisoli TaxID=3064525 RepID=A0ABT9CLK2_9BACL|nr:serine hydrolase domain-containing protein [Paenibacillus sp. JX-17]MDO7908802.1 serine hydrolase domain-containing protein [Paenibacillus sp. JX-17]